jgi:GNAT superfamily N-acetyltransferase
MAKTMSSTQVICRPALERDQADVIEFCRTIWDGEDYVPAVWEDWLNDPNGLLAVAETNGHAIGCSKVSLLSRGQWWLEGFRVDPAYQGLKVGSVLHSYVTDWWLAHGDGTLRLMTDAGNFAVHHLCQKTGYTKTSEVCGYKAKPLAEPTQSFSPVVHLSEAASFATESESIQATGGLVDLGWRILRPDPEVFETYASDTASFVHAFSWWRDRQGLFSAWEDEEDGIRTLVLGVVACALHDMPALLTDIRRLAASKDLDRIFQIAFDVPSIVSPLLAAGFEKKWKRSNAFVFEKEHPGKA